MLNHNSILRFLRNLHTVSTVAAPTYIPTNSVGGFPFLHPSPAFVICRFFDDGHSDCVRGYLIAVFICIYLIITNLEHLFMSLLAICMSSLEKCPFIGLGCLIFFVVEFMSCFGD